MLGNCEALTKSYNGPYRSSPEHKGSSQRRGGGGGDRGVRSPGYDFEEDSHSKFMSEHSRAKSVYEHDVEDSEALRTIYRRPRDVLLSLVGEFIARAEERLIELRKSGVWQRGDLFDVKAQVRVAEIAHTLLKVSPYDPESMGCRGLQNYMNYVLPYTNWSNDAMRPSIVTILRRLDKVFQKIAKKPSIRRNTDWDAAAGLLKGIYETMIKCPYIVHWSHIKALIGTCQGMILNDSCCAEGLPGSSAALMSQAPPANFCSMVVRLIGQQIQYSQVPYMNVPDFLLFFNQENCTLEQVCGGGSTFTSQEKSETIIMNLIMPLCLRVGSGREGEANI